MSFDPHTASALGVERRRARAELKASIAHGRVHILELFDSAEGTTDPVVGGLRVAWFLGSIPGKKQEKAKGKKVDLLGVRRIPFCFRNHPFAC